MYSATRLNQFNNKLNPCCRIPSTTRVVELLTQPVLETLYDREVESQRELLGVEIRPS
jgi:hypothetical protein